MPKTKPPLTVVERILQDNDRLLTQRETLNFLGWKSRTTIRRKLQQGLMPAPVRLPGGTLRWRLSQLSDWADSQPEQRY
jgi:predicted DNA-binding transcriptional regulator AlpA